MRRSNNAGSIHGRRCNWPPVIVERDRNAVSLSQTP